MNQPEIFKSTSDPELVRLLQTGAVGVLPTDTVYGLVACAADQAAVKRLYELKKREHKPGTVIASNIDQLVELGLKARYLKAVEHFWPNPLSIVIPSFELAYIHLQVGSIAVRIPAHAAIRTLLDATGPLLTTSANMPGEAEAVTIEQAQKYFGNNVDFYTEGGLLDHQPSTLIRIVDDAVEVLREGAVKFDEEGRIIT